MDTPAENSTVSAPMRGVAVASFGIGFFSMLVFWLFPFGFTLACFGFTLGLICNLFGLKGGMKGENFALLGMACSAFTILICISIFVGQAKVLWDY